MVHSSVALSMIVFPQSPEILLAEHPLPPPRALPGQPGPLNLKGRFPGKTGIDLQFLLSFAPGVDNSFLLFFPETADGSSNRSPIDLTISEDGSTASTPPLDIRLRWLAHSLHKVFPRRSARQHGSEKRTERKKKESNVSKEKSDGNTRNKRNATKKKKYENILKRER
jgi:hypothetical protein